MTTRRQALGVLVAAALLGGGGCRSGGPEGVVGDAVGGNDRRRAQALESLAREAPPEAVARLSEELEGQDPDRVRRAVAALVAAGDEAAVPALIDLSRRVEGPFVLEVVQGIGEIGGRQAEGYLFTLETGSPDEAVREAARQARAALSRRRAAAAQAPQAG